MARPKKADAPSNKKPLKKTPRAPKSDKKASDKKGHNSGVNQPLIDLFNEAASIKDKQKALGKALRDIRNRAKSEHGVLSENFQDELKWRMKDRDFRAQFESGREDLKKALGYQMSLNLNEEEEGDENEDPEAAANRLTGRNQDEEAA